MAKRGRKIQGDHKLTGMEIKRRQDDKAASIDGELDQAIANIDWDRRREAEKDIVKWVKTYCVPLMLNDDPPELGEGVLRTPTQPARMRSISQLRLWTPRSSKYFFT